MSRAYTVYVVRGSHWTERRAVTSRRAAASLARAWGGASIEASSYASLDEWIAERAISTPGGGRIVALREDTPPLIERAMTRRYGRPSTRDRGEVAYWEVG